MKIFIKILNAFLLISILFICSGCVIFPYTSPDDFEHTKWTCDDPEIYFYTNVNTSNNLGWLKIDGRIMLIEVHTVFNNKFTIESINDTDRKYLEDALIKRIIMGDYDCTSKEFIIYPKYFADSNEEGLSEDILNGRYEKLVFKRSDVSKEIDEERAELIAYYLLGYHCKYNIYDYNLTMTSAEDKWIAVFEKVNNIEGPEKAEFHLDLISGKLIFNSLVDTADIE